MNKIYLAGILLLNSLFAVAQDSTLIGHFTFSGNANDQSVYQNNGTVTGATLTGDRFGQMNKAYHFTLGSQIITAPVALNTTDEITVTAWLNMSHYPNNMNGNTYSNIFTYLGGSFYLQPLTDDITNLTLSTRPVVGSGVLPVYSFENVDQPLNSWFHVAFTHKPNGDVMLYLNGELVANMTSTPDLKAGSQIGIGNYFDQPSDVNQFLGDIDDVRIYKRELDSTEIMQVYTTENTNTGISSNHIGSSKINIYPNPANAELTIDSEDIENNIGVTIISADGKEAMKFTGKKADITSLSNGIYFVLLYTNNCFLESKKIIVNH
jgi:hypothetical protein